MNDLSGIQALVIDMDGVLWRGDQFLPGLAEFFALLRLRELPFVLVTNNATKTPAMVQEKLMRASISVSEEEILTSALATAAHLKQAHPEGRRVYAIGETGLRTALEQEGFELADQADGVFAVVVGLDRGLDWGRLTEATLAIRAGAQFIGTNPDASIPSERGLAPGNGAILAALQAATGVEPLVIGKPHAPLFEQALRRLGTPAEATLMLGDRLNTDIAGGRRAGLRTGLLLTGVTTREELEGADVQPDVVFEDLAAVMAALERNGA